MILRELPFADTTSLARLMRPEARAIVLEELPTRYAGRLNAALRYPTHQVGAWIDPQVPTLSAQNTAADALRVLRAAEPASHVFVEEETHGTYLGTISVRDVLRALIGTPLGELRIARTTPLSNRASLASVAFDARWDEFLYLPVVGRRGNLLGGLSRRTLREATQDHASASGPRGQTMFYEIGGALLLTCSALGTLILGPLSTRAERGDSVE
jgi:Mg/Co/Ni transporter MgtE